MYHKRKNNKDLKYIFLNLREQDEHELRLRHGKEWFKASFAIWKNLKGCRIAYKNDGTPVSVFGVLQERKVGIIGFLSTADIDKEQKSFFNSPEGK